MPVSQGTNAFNIGRDCSIVVQGPFGRVDLPNVTGFKYKQDTVAVKSTRLDGLRLSANIPDGWSGTFDLDRGSSGVDDFFALTETTWFVNGLLSSATIYQYVIETDGSTSTYQFTQCSMNLTDGGSWTGDAIVKQTISFEATRRQRI